MPINAVVVDDEPLARRHLRALLARHPEIAIKAECAGGGEALEFLREHETDLLFLDIQMPEVDGFDVLCRLETPKMPAVVFVTAYDRFAIKAFEVNAVDYLLKPVDDERFDRAVERAKTHLSRATE